MWARSIKSLVANPERFAGAADGALAQKPRIHSARFFRTQPNHCKPSVISTIAFVFWNRRYGANKKAATSAITATEARTPHPPGTHRSHWHVLDDANAHTICADCSGGTQLAAAHRRVLHRRGRRLPVLTRMTVATRITFSRPQRAPMTIASSALYASLTIRARPAQSISKLIPLDGTGSEYPCS